MNWRKNRYRNLQKVKCMVRKIKPQHIEEIKKEEKKETESKEEKVNSFSIKSALVILASSSVGTIVFPVLLLLFGVNMNFSILLGNTFITSFGFVWTRFFIDSKRGFCKKFWQQYRIWGIAFGLRTYFWMFRKKTI